MLNLRTPKRIVILGGGTAGWFAALTLRRIFSANVEVRVIESSQIGIVGVGEGGLLNIYDALQRNQIDIKEFMAETDATFKWGFSYEGWRTGKADDKFYHLFTSARGEGTQWVEGGFLPYYSALINQGVPLESWIRGFQLIKNNASMEEAIKAVDEDRTDLVTSFHFDSYKIAKYMKKVALSRGVVHEDVLVKDFVRNEEGLVTKLITEKGEVELDFLIDSSGLTRQVMAKMPGARWQTFKDYLLMDSAIPFYMPHPNKNPMLITRAITMDAGWMWQIPLSTRVGAGYVFSSKHKSEADAIDEIQKYLGFEIEPHKTIRFDPGCYEQVWIKNVMSLGLSSGFVEPLEATSIGQMIEQLRNFERVLVSSQGIISENSIREYNEANLASWHGIRDFLRMHYDCTRNDTPLWQEVNKSPMTERYAEFRRCIQERTPHLIDVENYAMNGWGGIFHPVNWMSVAVPLGLVPVSAAGMDLLWLSKDKQQKALDFVNRVKEKGW
ncbi:tryptophan 7-halogenase [Jinshanibacter sp. LJY008]|uniref:Tryptophan 7-halogenase n=1 Tax=Limnobaculum eriocheiris TaxID=2897391 RepID=A0A9X1MWI7_9GAMM|nr:tryptophan 7-halogenase [Limnobaculum eriocheiris]MCD1127021.1 tryptophan 7-halogenase [Limnobaculum eriocheiris]